MYKRQAYNALANSYQALGEFQFTEKYLNISFNYSKEINDFYTMSSSSSSLAQLYLNYYKDPDKALEYNKKSLRYETELNQPIGIFVAAYNISDLLLDLYRPNQAEEYIAIAQKNYDYYTKNIPKYGEYVPYYDCLLYTSPSPRD